MKSRIHILDLLTAFCILGVIFNLHPQVCYLIHTGADCEKEFKV